MRGVIWETLTHGRMDRLIEEKMKEMFEGRMALSRSRWMDGWMDLYVGSCY